MTRSTADALRVWIDMTNSPHVLVLRPVIDEFVRRARARRILDLRGSGLWEGDLSEMRADRSAASKPRQSGGRRGAR